MAKATINAPKLPPVALELTGDEAQVLFQYLVREQWPVAEREQAILNHLYDVLSDVGVETPN